MPQRSVEILPVRPEEKEGDGVALIKPVKKIHQGELIKAVQLWNPPQKKKKKTIQTSRKKQKDRNPVPISIKNTYTVRI